MKDTIVDLVNIPDQELKLISVEMWDEIKEKYNEQYFDISKLF